MSDRPPTTLAVVTCEQVPGLTEDGQALAAALRDRGLSVEPVVWTDGTVDWSAFDAALVRSCWDYYTRPAAFETWLESVEDAVEAVLNPVNVVEWNVHKFYLRDLAERGVSIVQTRWVERGSDASLRAVLAEEGWRDAVVKPAIGTSSAGTWRTSPDEAAAHQGRFEALVADGDALVQQFAPEIADGERSLVFFEGEYSHAFVSVPDAGDFRAHPSYGGTTRPHQPSEVVVERAAEVLRTAGDVLGIDLERLPYARVDGVERDDGFCLMELELVEPYLHLDVTPDAVDRFADAIERFLDRDPTPNASRE